MNAVVTHEPVRRAHLHTVCPIEESFSSKPTFTSSPATQPDHEDIHICRTKDSIYNRTLSWLKNLKPFTKHTSPEAARHEDCSLCFSNTSSSYIRSSRSDRNLARHSGHRPLDQNDELDLERCWSHHCHSRYSASLCLDRDYVAIYNQSMACQSQHKLFVSAESCSHSIAPDCQGRSQGPSAVDMYKASKSFQEIVYPQSQFLYSNPVPHQLTQQQITVEDHHQHSQLRPDPRVAERNSRLQSDIDLFCTCSRSFNKPRRTITSSSRDGISRGDQIHHQLQHEHKQTSGENRETNTHGVPDIASGTFVSRVLRQKLFARGKNSLSLSSDHETRRQEHQQSASSYSAAMSEAVTSAVKMRHKKGKHHSPDHMYVVNREDAMSRPRSCATLPHDVRLGELLHGHA